tara:strand:- start:273 stop:701 length:429 start_codon:yes stop_codon:yes gene_type:complete
MRLTEWFWFDNEPISGLKYFLRAIVRNIIILVSLYTFIGFSFFGVWLYSATIYKRAGAFKWKKDNRIVSCIFLPLIGILYSFVYNNDPISADGIFLLLYFCAVILNLYFIFGSGNRSADSCEKCGIKVDPNIRYCYKCETNL